MAKNIIFCADGTWNGPGKDEDGDSVSDATNVYKLFLGLSGVPRADSLRDADEQEKEFKEGGQETQVAKYIHGVGDSRNPIIKLMGGAFGSGIIARVVRGYTSIVGGYTINNNESALSDIALEWMVQQLTGIGCASTRRFSNPLSPTPREPRTSLGPMRLLTRRAKRRRAFFMAAA